MVMEKMHNASNSVLAKVLLALVSVSFLVTGMMGYLGSSVDTSAVKVNGEEISQQLFQQQFNVEYERLSQQYGASFSAIADTLEFNQGLRQSILNRLIDQELLRQYADNLKLAINDDQVKFEIVRLPSLQSNGKFDENLYQQLLQANGMNSDTFAHHVREGLRLDQLQSAVIGTDFLLPSQQKALGELLFQERTVRLATLPLADELAKQTVSEQEVADYYNSHKAAFAIPEAVKVQYIELTKEAAEKNVKVTDLEIQQYYQDNKSQFTTQGQQHLAHIQFANESEALDAYQALQNGTDFASLAKEKSLDKISAENGGDLGWLNVGDLPASFEEAVTGLEANQFSMPVKVDEHFHIIKLVERHGAELLPLDKVKDQIVSQIRQEMVSNQFYTLERQVAEKAFEEQASLEPAAEIAGVKVQETGYFSRRDIPKALDFANVVSTVFDSDISQGGANSEPMNVGELHSILVRVIEHQDEGMKSLEESKSEIEALLKRQKAEQAVLVKAQQEAERLTNAPDLKTYLKFGEVETWVYADNKDPQLNEAIFSMQMDTTNPYKHAFKAAQTNTGDVVVIYLMKVKNGDLSEEQQRALTTQISQGQAVDLQKTLLQALRNKAKIEVNESFMNQDQE